MTRSTTTREQRLYIDGHIQFSSRDEYRYHEYLVHPLLSIKGSRERVLVLGGGDGLAAREILKYDDVTHVDLVDIDPEMLRIGRELPILRRLNDKSMEDPRLHTYAQDAFSFINQPGILYDRVIIDMPDPHNEAINKLYSREFYTMISKRMKDGAVVVTQSSSPFYTRRVFWSIEETLAQVFDDTLSYHTSLPSFGIWGFNLARKNSHLPEVFSIDVETRALTNESMASALIFDKDIAKVDTPINSIMEPKLYQLYVEDLRR
jgi:spermidine synthase